jgi:exonuclease SbcD
MRILHTADWHLSNRQTIAGRFILQDGMNLTLIDRVEALGKICSYVENQGVDLVVIPGDIFDTSNPEAVAIKVAVQTIERLAEVTPVVLIRGNHDGKTSTASALAPFGKIARRDGIYVFEQPEVLSLIIKDTKVRVFALPYPRRSDFKQDPQLKSTSPEEISTYISQRMEETLLEFSSKINRDVVNILVGHFTTGRGSYSKEQNVPIFDISVRKEFLEPFDVVCLGHLHEPQEYYSGTIARNGFGEQDMKVGFKVYDLAMGISGKKICDIDEKFIELPAREFITLSPEEFINYGNINPDTAVRVKGKVPKHQYDEIVRKMKVLNHPFLKNALEVEMETAGSNGGQDISEEPDVEAALRMWAKGRDGIDKFIDRLVVKGKEVEAKMTESR